jgi:hypothetical protein
MQRLPMTTVAERMEAMRLSSRGPARLAWMLCGLATAATVLAVALDILIAGASHDVPADLDVGAGDLVWPVAVFGFAFVGALVASRQPGNAVGWVFCVGAVAFTLSGLTESYAVYTLFADPGGLLGGGETMAWVSVWVWVLGGVPLLILFPLLFPNGTLLSPRWRPVVWVAIAALVTLAVGIAFAPGPFDDFPEVENPYGVGGAAGDAFSAMQGLGWLLLILSLIAAATSLVLRFRRSRGVERLQLKWVAAASVVLVACFLLWEVWEGMAPLGIVAMVVAAGIAILRHRLYDIDVVINRTLVYGALTATLAGTYAGVVLLLQLVLSPGSDLAIAGSTLAVAALFRPARARIQAVVDRRFYRHKYDAQRTLEGFAGQLRDEVELDSLSAALRKVVAETMQPAHVSLWLRADR